MMKTPQDVVRAARGYLGVRFHHQGRNAAGLDCIGLGVRVGHDLNLSDFDIRAYGRRPGHISIEPLVKQICKPCEIKVGALVLIRFAGGPLPQHFGLIGDYPEPGSFSLIHSYAVARKVVEHRLDDAWRQRVVQAYELPGVDYSTAD